MSHDFNGILSGDPVVADERRAIRPAAAPFSFADEKPGEDPFVARPYVNDRLNSRLAQELGAGEWTILCSERLDASTRPRYLMSSAGRIVIQGDGPWTLLDADCRRLASGYCQGSGVSLDAPNGVFMLADAEGMIEARKLANGNRAYCVSTYFGGSYFRTSINRAANRLVVASVEIEIDQDSPDKPEESTIEVIEFEEPAVVDADQILQSAVLGRGLSMKTLALWTASAGDGIVAAAENCVHFLDFGLRVKKTLDGEFTPLSLSLNDAGIVFLVRSTNGGAELTALTPDGEAIYAVAVPESELVAPPIVAPDNRVFLLSKNRLASVSTAGEILWECRTRGNFGGAAVTADNRLLIADGEELGAFGPDGAYRVLFEFENETLVTPPIMSKDGDIYVASAERIFRLTRRNG